MAINNKRHMKQIVAFILLLVCVVQADAKLVEYTTTGIEKKIGAGNESSSRYGGLMVHEVGTTKFTYISWSPSSVKKEYFVSTVTNNHLTTIEGANYVSSTVVTHSIAGTLKTNGMFVLHDYMMRGINQTLTIDENVRIVFPARFSSPGNRELWADTNLAPVLTFWSDTFVFSAARTLADNQANKTTEDVISDMSVWLEGRGYIRH